MKQSTADNDLPLKIRKAASRLSEVFQLDSILQYAATLHDPNELKVIRKMISNIGLRSRCRKADIVELTSFIDSLIDNFYRPTAVNQYNNGCQQFFGPMNKTEMNQPNINNPKNK